MDFLEFGKNIAHIRKSKKITQAEIAKDLNISRATISSFENGSFVDIGFKKVLLIMDYLDLEIDIKEKSSFPIFEELLNDK